MKMEQKEFHQDEHLSFKDTSNHEEKKHGLRGVIQIYRKNKETGEVSFWDESENIITLSGYQFILMKAFGLFLDSSHGRDTDNLTRDTNLATPDLNTRMQIGVEPDEYSMMNENISSKHICQGFMIGNGGAGEDSVTTKNTSYSFITLRNPIPFQQDTSFSPTIANKYLGIYHGTNNTDIQSAYIKKFDSRPKIYHSWWVDGQRWDYVDPVTEDYLGPSTNTTTNWKTNRIESYIECKLSLSDTDCLSYFNHENNSQTAMVNELGLVAFDVLPGSRSILEGAYDEAFLPMFELLAKILHRSYLSYTLTPWDIYSANDAYQEDPTRYITLKELTEMVELAYALKPYLSADSPYYDSYISNERLAYGLYGDEIAGAGLSYMVMELTGDRTLEEAKEILANTYTSEEAFNTTIDTYFYEVEGTGASIFHQGRIDDVFNRLTSPDGLNLIAYYNQNETFMYLEDDYLTLLQDVEMSDLTLDEAQRVKLVTYYTFNSIPLSENWEILINYRIYAN